MDRSYLFADTYYPAFLEAFYEAHPERAAAGYDGSLRALLDQAFGTSDFYSKNLSLLGRRAKDVIPNDRILQQKWATEQGVKRSSSIRLQDKLGLMPFVRRFADHDGWMFAILEAQVKSERPDVLYLQDLTLCEPEFITRVRPFVRLIVGQIASPLPARRYLSGCDVILTSFPHYVDRFRAMGIASEYFRIGFEPTLLDRLTRGPVSYGAVFVGGIADVHARGTEMLERLAHEVDLEFWGYGVENLDPGSALRRRYHGQAWGLDMYNVFHNSRLVVNRHSSASENYANNMRLYEATGVGAMLVTDEKDNLSDLFEVGSEVVAYRNADDLVDQVRYYLAHEDERAQIARAGQARTLRDHTYLRRMEKLEDILEPYLQSRTAGGGSAQRGRSV